VTHEILMLELVGPPQAANIVIRNERKELKDGEHSEAAHAHISVYADDAKLKRGYSSLSPLSTNTKQRTFSA
jgi:hypothetical protein